ncbi:unnamed protein product [Pylaiella littoralis]
MVIELLDNNLPLPAGPVAVADDCNTPGLVLVKKARDLLVLFRKQQAGAARAANPCVKRLPEGKRPRERVLAAESCPKVTGPQSTRYKGGESYHSTLHARVFDRLDGVYISAAQYAIDQT